MDNSRHAVSPTLGEFLGAILGERNPARSAAFAAAILREHGPDERRGEKGRRPTGISQGDWLDAILHGAPATFDPFAGVLREYNFNPDEPRDEKGRWTTGDSGEKSPEERRQDLLKAMMPKTPTVDESAARADDNSEIFGLRKFTGKDGRGKLDARFAGFDKNGRVLLRRAGEKDSFAADPKYFRDADKKFLADLAKLRDDKGFIAGLNAKPPNIHLDSTDAKEADRPAWEADVIRNVGMLSELGRGRQVLDAAKEREREITITPTLGDNHARGGTVNFNPGNTTGARTKSGNNERPPFIGLGQELFNAAANLSPGTAPLAQREQNGLRVGQQLRVEYNQTIGDAERLKELTERYPGWGTRAVDENVLGPDLRPLPRRRDR